MWKHASKRPLAKEECFPLSFGLKTAWEFFFRVSKFLAFPTTVIFFLGRVQHQFGAR